MGTDVVVVGDEAVEGDLELLFGLDAVAFGQVLLQRLMEALDLSAGLWVIGPRVLGGDAQADELGFEQPGTAPGR
jgi:hypothetical protein